MKLKKLNKDNLKKGTAEGLILVDFYADWCPPCKALLPTMKKLAEKSDQAVIAKVNTEDSPEIAQEFNVKSIPTSILLKNGNEVDRLVGNVSLKNLEALIESAL